MKGVAYDSTNKKYKAYINIANDKVFLGTFPTAEAAHLKRIAFDEQLETGESVILSYLKYKTKCEENDLKQYIINALPKYLESSSGRTFFGFCKTYILNEIRANRMPVFEGMPTWENFISRCNEYTRPIVINGNSIKSVEDEYNLLYPEVIAELRKIMG